MEFLTTDQWNEDLWDMVKDIYFEAFKNHSPKPETIIRNMFAKRLCSLHVVIEGTHTVAMALTGSIRDSRILLIDYLAVEKEYQNRGIGKGLNKYIREWAVAHKKFDTILIEVESEKIIDNIARIRFWEKCGYLLLKDYTHQYIWVPELYQAMYISLQKGGKVTFTGQELFKYIESFHKASFRRR
ncbi:GNAT family N-acetyltransferase [Peribacillus saganii]|uniref:GNAT family N-acetyltransferase n=1 Tax=Peribacillus saganii TaxID=2303992 RepID=A0A372LJU0_9BACI|nr:GNAT family N-acetyltransferase [Peribacillus saganii]RFU66401.1 GNAT family N-acetyltransferase [Peribacillus saganii]